MATGSLYVRDLRFYDAARQAKTAAIEGGQPARHNQPAGIASPYWLVNQ